VTAGKLRLRNELRVVGTNRTEEMKSLAITAALFLATLPVGAFAQEESPTPDEKLSLRATDESSPSDPVVSVPSERNSGQYPRPGTPLSSPTPAASKSPSVAPTSVATKAASTARPSPALKSTPAAPSAAAKAASPFPATATPKAAASAVKEMENKWLAALQSHDAATVDSLVADNYIGVTSTGRFANKAALIADMKRDKNKYDSATNTRMDVRVHGDTAVVVGTTQQVGKDEADRAFTYYYRWTDTWVLRDGQWLCVASQSIQVPK